jgi:hypothetical protein
MLQVTQKLTGAFKILKESFLRNSNKCKTLKAIMSLIRNASLISERSEIVLQKFPEILLAHKRSSVFLFFQRTNIFFELGVLNQS